MKRLGAVLSVAALFALVSVPFIFAKDIATDTQKKDTTCCVSKCCTGEAKCADCCKVKSAADKKCNVSDKEKCCSLMSSKNDGKSEKKSCCGENAKTSEKAQSKKASCCLK